MSRSLLAVPARPDVLIPALASAWEGGPAVLVVDPAITGPLAGQFTERFKPTHVLKHGSHVQLPYGVPVSDDTMLVVPTSGSTGVARGVCLSRKALEFSVTQGLERTNSDPTIPWVCPLPLTHIAGILTVLRGFVTQTATIVHDGFTIHDIAALNNRPHIAIVPTMARRLMEAKVSPDIFSTVLIGGARVDADIREYFADAWLTYGMTETAGGVVYNGAPFAGVSAQTTPTGRVRIGGPSLMEGYRTLEQTSESTWTDVMGGLDDDGWFTTSDLGMCDDDGLHITGRMDDMIITGGVNVLATTIEDALAEHDLIAASCVIGVDDPEWGQRVVAVIVPDNPQMPGLSHHLGTEAIKLFIRETLPDEYAPKDVLLVRALPELPNGKIDRVGIQQTVAAMYEPEPAGGGCGGGCCGGACGSGGAGGE